MKHRCVFRPLRPVSVLRHAISLISTPSFRRTTQDDISRAAKLPGLCVTYHACDFLPLIYGPGFCFQTTAICLRCGIVRSFSRFLPSLYAIVSIVASLRFFIDRESSPFDSCVSELAARLILHPLGTRSCREFRFRGENTSVAESPLVRILGTFKGTTASFTASFSRCSTKF